MGSKVLSEVIGAIRAWSMAALREAGDSLELMIPHEGWPLATYREMLFVK